MSKKYMDFMPASPEVKASTKKTVIKKSSSVNRPVSKAAAINRPKPVARRKPEVVREEVVLQEDILEVEAGAFSLKKEPVYGVIEDYRPKFVKTEVKKRPLSRSHFVEQESELVKAKSVKVATRGMGKSVKPVEKSGVSEKKKEDKTKMQIPKSPFINQGKVTKRPLSKNIYERTIKPTEEKSTGPVTIISKPEKDSRAGRVIAVILAIILGAIAGAVAFLLLPK